LVRRKAIAGIRGIEDGFAEGSVSVAAILGQMAQVRPTEERGGLILDVSRHLGACARLLPVGAPEDEIDGRGAELVAAAVANGFRPEMRIEDDGGHRPVFQAFQSQANPLPGSQRGTAVFLGPTRISRRFVQTDVCCPLFGKETTKETLQSGSE